MMNKIVIICFLLCIAVTCSYSAPACVPRQFEALSGLSIGQSINGTNTAISGLMNFSFDADRKQIAMSGTLNVNGKPFKEQSLQDFNTGVQYVAAEGKCYKMPLYPKTMLTCMPADAKKLMSTYQGYGDKKLEIDLYYFEHEGMQISMGVVKDSCNTGNCIIVSEHLQNAVGITDTGFMGITMGIRDPSVFDIPAPCKTLDLKPAFSPRMKYMKNNNLKSMFLQ